MNTTSQQKVKWTILNRFFRFFDFFAGRRDGLGLGLDIDREDFSEGTFEEFCYGKTSYTFSISLAIFCAGFRYYPSRPHYRSNQS